MKRPNKTTVIQQAALLALMLPALARAQDSGAAAAPSSPGVQSLPTVIVTARKKLEPNQDVPGGISVIGAQTLERQNIRSIDEVAKLTAGLTFDADFGRLGDRPIIRGQATIIGETGVSYFIDGVYYTGSLLDFNLADVESIEVIKGPQSALYGRNTYAGAISIKTKAPTLAWTGDARLGAAQFGQTEASARISGPLIRDELAVSLSASQYDRDGVTGKLWRNQFDGRAFGGESSRSLNIGGYWTPSSKVDVRTRLTYSWQNDDAPPLFLQGYQANNSYFDNGNRRPTVLDGTGAPVGGGGGSVYLGAGRFYTGEIKAQPINVDDKRSLGVTPVNATEKLLAAVTVDFKLDDRNTLTYTLGANRNRSHDAYDADYQPTSYGPFLTSSVGLRPRTSTADPGDYEYAVSTGAPAVNFSAIERGLDRDQSHELRWRIKGKQWDALLGAYYYQSRSEGTFKQDPVADWGNQLKESLAVLQARMQAACNNFFKGRPGFADCTSIVRRASSLNPAAVAFDSTANVWTTFPDSASRSETRNAALFGALNYKLARDVEVSGELRAAREVQKVLPSTQKDTAYFANLTENTPFSNVTEVPAQQATFKAFTPRFTGRWDITPDNHLYGVIAKGNKPGGINGVKAAEVGYGTFKEETAWSTEIGSKNTFLNNRLLLNVAVFNNDISNYQLTDSIVYADGSASTARKNLGKTNIKGLEFELRYLPEQLRGLDLHLNYAYTRARIRSGSDATQGVLNDVADDGQLNCSQGLQPAYQALVSQIIADHGLAANTLICHNVDGTVYFGRYGDVAGRTLPRVPTHALNFGFDYSLHGASDWVWNIGANLAYESRKFVQVDNLAWYGQVAQLSAHLGLSNGNFGVSLWGKNLNNADSAVAASRYTDATNQNLRAFFGTPRLPRQIGLTGSYKF